MTDEQRVPEGDEAPTTAASPRAAQTPRREEREVGAFSREAYGMATSRGYGNAMGRGFEIAITLAVMVGIGWLVDRIFDTAPLFIIIFSVLGFAGTTVKLWLGYDLEMRKHEDGAVWNRKAGAS